MPKPKSTNQSIPEIRELIKTIANKYNVPYNIADSVVYAESGYNPRARSKVGALGLMQLMPGTAKELRVVDPFDPEQNLEGGIKYLAQMYKAFKVWPLALAAYNAGPGRVQRAGNKIPNIKETLDYVNKIMNRAESM